MNCLCAVPGKARNGGGIAVGTVPRTGLSLKRVELSLASSSVTKPNQQPLEQQLEEIGTQLAWVRDYL
jgi:hypothetical protein